MPAVVMDAVTKTYRSPRTPAAEGARRPGPAGRVRRRARVPRAQRLGQDDDDPGAARPRLRRRRRRTIRLLDRPVPEALPEVIGGVGALVETPLFFPGFSGRLQPAAARRGRRRVPRPVEECLEIVDLRDRADDRFKGYSLGMKQRLGIAAALLKAPAAADPRRAEQRPGPGRHPRRPRADPPARPRRAHDGAAVLAPARGDPAGLRLGDDPGRGPLRGHRPGRPRCWPAAPPATSVVRVPDRGRRAARCCSAAGFAVSPDDARGRPSLVHAVAVAGEITRRPGRAGHYLEELTPMTPDLESAFLAITGGAGMSATPAQRAPGPSAVATPPAQPATPRGAACCGPSCTASAPAASSRSSLGLGVCRLGSSPIVIGLLNFGDPDRRRLRRAPAAGRAGCSPSNEQFRQQCLDDPRQLPRHGGLSPEELCGPELTARTSTARVVPRQAAVRLRRRGHGRRPRLRRPARPSSPFLIGATWIGAEWSSRSIVALLFWVPQRMRVMGTKIAVLVGGGPALRRRRPGGLAGDGRRSWRGGRQRRGAPGRASGATCCRPRPARCCSTVLAAAARASG